MLGVPPLTIPEVIMIALAYILSGVSLLASVLLLIQTKHPPGWIALIPKLIAGALSPSALYDVDRFLAPLLNKD
jgi:hypothetical protein